MTYRDYIALAKTKGVTLTQSRLYRFAEVGLTEDEETRLCEEKNFPDDLDPKIVFTLAERWNIQHQYDKIPREEYMKEFMACC